MEKYTAEQRLLHAADHLADVAMLIRNGKYDDALKYAESGAREFSRTGTFDK